MLKMCAYFIVNTGKNQFTQDFLHAVMVARKELERSVRGCHHGIVTPPVRASDQARQWFTIGELLLKSTAMTSIKTPCIGICSTTSLGDAVCRGCKRYAIEVIHWNSYDAVAKAAVLKRIELLICQILQHKFTIFSEQKLRSGLERWQIPYDPSQSSYCWLHNLLKKHHQQIVRLEDFGSTIVPQYAELSLPELTELAEQEILLLCEAHFSRYIAVPTTSVMN
jgi:predicted Fe-S protein YdhL (DUF1289 family)